MKTLKVYVGVFLLVLTGVVLSQSVSIETFNEWLSKSFISIERDNFEFGAIYNSNLNLKFKLLKSSYLYLYIKTFDSKMLLINLGFFSTGEHSVDVNLPTSIDDKILLLQLLSTDTPLLTVEKLENATEILDFLAKHYESFKMDWKVVFKYEKGSLLKLYSNHGKNFEILLDGQKIGQTPVFTEVVPGIHRLTFRDISGSWAMFLCLLDDETQEIDLSEYSRHDNCMVQFYFEIDQTLKFDFEDISSQENLYTTKGIHAVEVLENDIPVFFTNVFLSKDNEKLSFSNLKLYSILIKTTPESMVFINGSFRGLTDKNGTLLVESLSEEIAIVKIIKPGYLNLEFPVVLDFGINVVNKPSFKLKKILVKTNYKPVKIFMDGKYFDIIDKNVQYISLPYGIHTFRFENSHCYTIQETIDVSEKEEIILNFEKLVPYIYAVAKFDGKDLKIDLISSEKIEIELKFWNETKVVFDKKVALKEGHNYFEMKNLKGGTYTAEILYLDVREKLQMNVVKEVKFEIKKLFVLSQNKNQ